MSQPDEKPRIIRFDEINQDRPSDDEIPTTEDVAAEIYASLPSPYEIVSLPPASNIQTRMKLMKSLRTLLDL